MEWFTLIKGSIIGAIVLFFWNGLAQNVFPWGIKSVKEVNDQKDLSPIVPEDDEQGMFYIRSEKVVMFLAAKPSDYYSMSKFLGLEFVTQWLVSLILTAILLIIPASSLEFKLTIVTLICLISIVAVDLQYWNWWGFSGLYTIGLSFNRLIGFLLASGILIFLGF
ncbi:MAG: hypothetical protein AB4062_18265 [Crocosphaera sp.]